MDAARTPVFRRLGPVAWRGVLALFIAGPIAWAMLYALAYSLGGVGRLSSGWTTEHWRNAFVAPGIMGAFAYSVVIALIVTTLVVLITLGMLLSFPSIRHNRAFLLMVIVLMGTPSLVLAQMVGNTLGQGGWLSRLSYHAGLIETAGDFPALVNDRLHVGMTISLSLSLLPLVLLYFSQLWGALRLDRCCDLAQSLGASRLDARLRVALPMLIWRGKSMMMLLFILTIGSYEVPLLLGRQSPQMFSVATQRLASGFDLSRKPQAYVLAILYLVCTSLALMLYIRGKSADA